MTKAINKIKSLGANVADAQEKSERLMEAFLDTLLQSSSSAKTKMGNQGSSEGNYLGTKNIISRTRSPSPNPRHKQAAVNSPGPPDYLIKLAKILVGKSLAEDNLDGVSRNVFMKYICPANQPLGKRLFNYFIANWEKRPDQAQVDQRKVEDLISKDAFLQASTHFVELLSDSAQLQFFIKVYAKEQDKIEQTDVFDLIQDAYQTAKVAHLTCCLPDDIINAVVKAVMHGKQSVSTKYLHGWISQHCHRLVMWMHRYVSHNLAVGHRTIPLNTDEKEDDTDTPILDHREDSPCNNLHPALIWLLTCTLPTLYTKPQSKNLPAAQNLLLDPHVFIDRMISAVSPTHWVPLYNSDNHGNSLNRFQHHVFDYNGPTLVFVMAEDENLFCLACDEHWRDSKHFWGGEHCYCLQLTPEYKIVESGPKLMYFNISSRGFPTGIHVGQDFTNRALTLNLDLTTVTYRGIPYGVRSIEVWGCGTVEAREAQMEMKKHEIKDTEMRKKINLNSVDWVDNPDRYLLELAGTRPNYAQYDRKTQGKQSTN